MPDIEFEFNNVEDVKRLLSGNPGLINQQDADHKTILAIAVEQRNLEVARYLVNNGALPVLEFPKGFSPKPWIAKFFQDQIAYRARGDWDGIMRDFYCDDCEMLSFNFVLKGKEPIKRHFIEGNRKAGKLIAFSIDDYNESDDAVIMRSSVLSEYLLVKASDSYLFRDQKVLLFTALTEPPEKTKDWALKWYEWDNKFKIHMSTD